MRRTSIVPPTRRVAALALALTALVAVVAVPSHTTTTERHHDGIAVLATAGPRQPHLAVREPRSWPFTPVVIATALTAAVGMATPRRRFSPSLIAYRRRISDVGDDWRALLLGAPPASA